MANEVEQETKTTERRSFLHDPTQMDTLEPRAVAHPRPRLAQKAETTSRAKFRAAEHVVFLVPGLLGFERVSTFSYFADRVVAALRASLEQSWNQPVPVIAVPIPATAPLHVRQRMLVKTLADRVHALEHGHHPLHVHLVGHSTGGLDANLLTHEKPWSGSAWTDLDPRAPALLARIRSVVSIGSPHQGACIVRDPTARFLSKRDLRGIPPLASLCGRFALSVLNDVEVSEFLTSAGREIGKAFRFCSELVSRWRLLEDLQPTRSPTALRLKPDVMRRSFVTIAGRPRRGASSNAPADALFRELAERASGWSTGCAEEGDLVHASVARLKEALASKKAGDLLIKAPGAELPPHLDAGHNDGIVNAARQLIDPSDPDELGGIVVGDHFDVVGYYDRHAWTVDDDGQERSILVRSGLLHSGSGFRDDEFFELYQRVANVITQTSV